MNTDKIIELLGELAIREHVLRDDDPWYSCPKAEDGSANPAWGKDECSCGVDEHNAKVMMLIKQYKIAKGDL